MDDKQSITREGLARKLYNASEGTLQRLAEACHVDSGHDIQVAEDKPTCMVCEPKWLGTLIDLILDKNPSLYDAYQKFTIAEHQDQLHRVLKAYSVERVIMIAQYFIELVRDRVFTEDSVINNQDWSEDTIGQLVERLVDYAGKTNNLCALERAIGGYQPEVPVPTHISKTNLRQMLERFNIESIVSIASDSGIPKEVIQPPQNQNGQNIHVLVGNILQYAEANNKFSDLRKTITKHSSQATTLKQSAQPAEIAIG